MIGKAFASFFPSLFPQQALITEKAIAEKIITDILNSPLKTAATPYGGLLVLQYVLECIQATYDENKASNPLKALIIGPGKYPVTIGGNPFHFCPQVIEFALLLAKLHVNFTIVDPNPTIIKAATTLPSFYLRPTLDGVIHSIQDLVDRIRESLGETLPQQVLPTTLPMHHAQGGGLQKIRPECIKNMTFTGIEAEIQKITLPQKSQHVIMATHVFHYVAAGLAQESLNDYPELKIKALLNLLNALKPGGDFVTDSHISHFIRPKASFLEGFQTQQLTHRDLERFCRYLFDSHSLSFEVKSFTPYRHYETKPGEPQSAVVVLTRK
jgi:hypothetical protein